MNILIFVAVVSSALTLGSMGYMVTTIGTRDYAPTKRKLVIGIITIANILFGGFIGYALGRTAGF